MRAGKSFDNEGYDGRWHIAHSAQLQKFPRQGETDVCSLHIYPNDISFSLHNLFTIPVGWEVRKNSIQQHILWVISGKEPFFFFFVFMIKHPNIYPSGITSLGWIQETLVTRAISHHKSPNKLSFSLPLLICHGAQPSCLKSSTFWQWLQFQDDGAILFHIHHYYF